jgi:signal transduction histidine kinase
MQARSAKQQYFSSLLSSLHRGFDAVATWVTHLSWWKFLLFAGLTLIAAEILQEELFAGPADEEIVRASNAPKKNAPSILIDDSGIHFNPNKPHAGEPVPPVPPAVPAPPAPGLDDNPQPQPAHPASASGEVHIELPPQMSAELSDAIENEINDAAEAKVSRYHKQASTWFTSFVWLLILALFGTKALVGGKKRAEAETQSANAAAERESMQRQLSEARMQAMQAQVEPHFLFNTLASVEYLIETNPPRASAMQRSLIQYLRAVLPQMRESNLTTNLGREVDMVTAYLDLLKMRMEERLVVDIQIPEGLRTAAFPPMMLQSLVENAIKHGLECKPEGGHLRVQAEVAHSMLRVTVADDGVGFGVMPSNGTGLGLTNIRERLKLLHGDSGQLHITPNVPCGVIATIEIPYKLAAAK